MKAAVIGAGFGGLALAIRLQAQGMQTTLFEARDKPGGRGYVYEQDGFIFDAGPTVITDPAAIQELFTLAGRPMIHYVTLLPVSPFYRLCWEDGTQFDYDNDQASLDRQITALNPADVAGYRRFLAYSEAVYAEGYVKLGAVPFLNFRDMVRAGPALMRLQAWRSVYAIVAHFIAEPHLREAFSFHSLLVGGNPFETSSIYALIHALERRGGVWFAKGGTGALVAGLVRLFQDLGGELRLNASVDAITTANGRVTGIAGPGVTTETFDCVASNADVMHTYRDLLRDSQRGRREAVRLARKRYSMSLFVIYFGLSRNHTQLQHHTICFCPRYRELISEIFGAGELAKDFSLYLHAPCVTDPSLAPPGSGAYYVLAPVPHLGHAAIDWDIMGPIYRDRIFAYLEEHYMPGLRADLVTSRIFTPFGFRDELHAHLGSAFSVEPILTQSAWFRPHNRDAALPNLYLVGAGTHPGAGIPGVIGSAKATAGLMLRDAGLIA